MGESGSSRSSDDRIGQISTRQSPALARAEVFRSMPSVATIVQGFDDVLPWDLLPQGGAVLCCVRPGSCRLSARRVHLRRIRYSGSPMIPLITSPLKNSASRLACVSIAAELAGGAALVSTACSRTTCGAAGDGVAAGLSEVIVPVAWGVWLAAGARAVRTGAGWPVVCRGPMLSPPASRET
jgi:hypothetical protein